MSMESLKLTVMTPEKTASLTADKNAALQGQERLFEIRPALKADENVLIPLSHLFAGSDFLTNWLLNREVDLDWIVSGNVLQNSRSRAEMIVHMDDLLQKLSPISALRIFKNRELCRIAARELSGIADFAEAVLEWSCVADISIDTAIKAAERDALKERGVPIYVPFEKTEPETAKICAIAMGKLGGGELNISSDIDIIFVHSSDQGSTPGVNGKGVVTLHEFFVGVAREAVRLLSEMTEDGNMFRVDLDLRPEGTRGEVTNSIGAMEVYYESWGQNWERQALIKARYCGGDKSVADETLERLRPFVYRKYIDQKAVDEIALMKGKIDSSLIAKKGAKRAGRDIKLGEGGIREIEFLAQSLQLLYGARYPELKTRSTLEALDVSYSLGILSEPHYIDLSEAYIFYRRLENRIQYYQGAQTHLVPTDETRLIVLARQMGMENDNLAERLATEISRRRKRVRGIFNSYFAKSNEDETDAFPVSLDDEEAVVAWLDSLGFDRPKDSARALNFLRNGRPFSHPSERSRTAFDKFGPAMVKLAMETSWPDNVIVRLAEFVESKGGRGMLYSLLDTHRPVLSLLSAIFSSSEHQTLRLITHPDILDRLLISDPVGMPPSRIQCKRELASAVKSGKTVGEQVAGMNFFRVTETMRLSLRSILGLAQMAETMEGLTILSEEYIKKVTDIACDEVGTLPDGTSLAVIVAGKLGKREMSFSSDVDMLVFYEGGEEGRAYVTRVTQEILKLSSMQTSYGIGYDIDLRLRPDGEKGLLVSSLKLMKDYYKNRGQEWERIALVGARQMAGDETFGDKVMQALRSFIFAGPFSVTSAKKLAYIRERVADEKVKVGTTDIKFGRGGMMDIEFICQWLKIEKETADSVQDSNGSFTFSVLSEIKEKEWLPLETASELEKNYHLYRAIEEALRMDRGKSVSVIPKPSLELKRMVRKVGEKGVGPDRFIQLVKETMKRTRAIYRDFTLSRVG